MAWTNVNFPFGSLLPALTLTELFQNFEAMAQGQLGAPAIRTGALTMSEGNPNVYTISVGSGVTAGINAGLFFFVCPANISVEMVTPNAPGGVTIVAEGTAGFVGVHSGVNNYPAQFVNSGGGSGVVEVFELT